MNAATVPRSLHLPPRYLAIVQDILRRYLPQAEVWAYGSRVNGDHYDASDLDLVARQPDDLTRKQPDLDEAAAAFSDSDLPILVQILDWARIPPAFREEIEVGYVVLQLGNSATAAPTDEDADGGSPSDCSDQSDRSDWFPSSAWEPGPGSSASRAEDAKQSFASRIPKQSLGTSTNGWRLAQGCAAAAKNREKGLHGN